MLEVEVGGILVVSAYAPPSWTLQELEQLLDNIVLTVNRSSKFIVAGDFNAWSASWANTLGAFKRRHTASSLRWTRDGIHERRSRHLRHA